MDAARSQLQPPVSTFGSLDPQSSVIRLESCWLTIFWHTGDQKEVCVQLRRLAPHRLKHRWCSGPEFPVIYNHKSRHHTRNSATATLKSLNITPDQTSCSIPFPVNILCRSPTERRKPNPFVEGSHPYARQGYWYIKGKEKHHQVLLGAVRSPHTTKLLMAGAAKLFAKSRRNPAEPRGLIKLQQRETGISFSKAKARGAGREYYRVRRKPGFKVCWSLSTHSRDRDVFK